MNARHWTTLAGLSCLILIFAPGAAIAAGSVCDGDWCPPCPPLSVPEGVIFITPGGNGPSLASQGMILEVEMVDCNGDVPSTTPQDITLHPLGGSVVFCDLAAADAPLDAEGRTQFSGVLAGGGNLLADGSPESRTHVYLFGQFTAVHGDVSFVSPDLTADLRVDLADVAEFGAAYFMAVYDFRVDLRVDGKIDIVDLAMLAIHLGERCD